MGKYTNEKSLMVVQDNFLSKVKKFFAKAFWNKRYRYDDYEEIEEENNYANKYQVNEYASKGRKLYNFDADNTDEWPGDANVGNAENSTENTDDNGVNYNDYSNGGNIIDGRNVINGGNNINGSNGIENINNEEDAEEDYDREIYSEAYIEKMELERKLMNYYESIKKGIQFE